MLSYNSFKEQRRNPKGYRMKYLVLKSTVANGGQVRAGDVIELSPIEAKELLGIGRVTKVESKPVETVDRAIGLEEATKPKRRTSRKKI